MTEGKRRRDILRSVDNMKRTTTHPGTTDDWKRGYETLDAHESTLKGCSTCHFACACREARMQEIVDAANRLIESMLPLRAWDDEARRLAVLLSAWQPVNKAAMKTG